MHFIIDILQDLNEYSSIFQEKGGLIIGKSTLIKQLFDSIDEFTNRDGPIVINYLNNVQCTGFDKCTEEIYVSNQVFWQNEELTVTTDISPLSSFKYQLLSNLIVELNGYFNLEFIQNFDIFTPINIPRDEKQFDTYGQKEIENIANYFKLNSVIIKKEWSTFLKLIFSDKDNWCKFEDQEPHVFYQFYLQQNIPINVKKFLEIILTLPIGKYFLKI